MAACGRDPCEVELLRHLKPPFAATITQGGNLYITKVFDEYAFNAREVGGWVYAQSSYGRMLRTGYICELPDLDPKHPEKPPQARIGFVQDVPRSYNDLLRSGRRPIQWETLSN